MIRINAKEARKNFSHLLDEVEQGEEILVLRRGHVVAHILPHVEKKALKRLPSLKEFRKGITMKGTLPSEMIIKERDEERN